jgi:hypothetical protein
MEMWQQHACRSRRQEAATRNSLAGFVVSLAIMIYVKIIGHLFSCTSWDEP